MTSENENGSVYVLKQQTSRKWILVVLVLTLATLCAFVPPMLSAWVFGAAKPLILLSGTEWVSVITMVTAAYIGGNVWQKHIQKNETQANGSISISASTELRAGSAPSAPDPDDQKEA